MCIPAGSKIHGVEMACQAIIGPLFTRAYASHFLHELDTSTLVTCGELIVNFEDVINLLKNVPLFYGVAFEHLDRHLVNARQLSLASGQVLMSPGESHEKVIVILSGRLRVNSGNVDNEPIAIFGPGESIGELSILDDQKSYAFLIADTDCTLLEIDHSAIWALVNDSHQAAINLLNIVARRKPVDEEDYAASERHMGYIGLNHVDELTGLYNSKWMYQIFGRQIYRCSVNHSLATMMLLSIDHFRNYNEAHGGLGGDQAMRTVAQTILNCLRPNDHAARYHGKNFIIFLPSTSLSEGRKAADRLLAQIREAHIVTPSGDALPGVTASIGLVEITEKSSIDQALEQTTEAVQRARDAGRNCISE